MAILAQCRGHKDARHVPLPAVLFTPMLVKRRPLPRSYVLGDLSNSAAVLELLHACGVRPTR